MSFSRHEEIYRSDGRERGGRAAAPGHRCDEFPAGYSLAGCSPAEPASAWPAGLSIAEPIWCDNQIAANRDVSLFPASQTWGPLQTVPTYCPHLLGFHSDRLSD